MAQKNGLPIAAYLGMLVALALAAAFVATLAIVIYLPPRPPDVMRADAVADHFQAGYDHMTALGRPPNERGVVWEVRSDAPVGEGDHGLMRTQHRLAGALDLRPDQVRASASHIKMDDAIVFRVGDIEAMAREAGRTVDPEQVLAELQHAHERAAERVEAARQAAQAAAEARAEAEAERQSAAHEREIERHQAQLEALAERQAREAERQARAAERLAARLHNRVRIEDGAVIVTEEIDRQGETEANAADPQAPERRGAAEIRAYRFEIPAPPAPPAAAHAPPVPPSHASTAPVPPAPPVPPMFAPAPSGVVLISGFAFGAQLPDGRWLVMRQGRNWAELGWIGRAALVIGGTLLLLTILATLFARRLTRPIRSFADAVQAVGVDPQSEPVREEGPSELRGAARAVNTMQARLRALIADRTKTLAAVAHDMRTPLMRLRLAAENVPAEQRERMAREIAEVEALVASFIAFARDDPAEEARVRLDLTALLHTIADDHAEHGRNVTFDGGERVVITGQSLGLKRLFGNLVENALKYGASARIMLRQVDDAAVEVDVEDDGPGIPSEQRESVFEPFVRLNEEGTRGAGLGLAAARSIARAHGGNVVILDGKNGALVRVTLPAQ